MKKDGSHCCVCMCVCVIVFIEWGSYELCESVLNKSNGYSLERLLEP